MSDLFDYKESDDDVVVDARFLPDDEDENVDDKIINVLKESSEMADKENEFPSDDEDDDSFALTMEEDPRYDLYPMGQKRPTNLFKQPLYERQPGEPLLEYQQFLSYSTLPPEKRNLRVAWITWREDNGFVPSKQPSTKYRDIASHWRWPERAYLLDLQRNKIAQQIWIDRDVQRREDDWKAADKLRDKALAAIETYDSDDLAANSIARWLELASSLQEKAVPDMNLPANELSDLINSLPQDRRDRVIQIAIAKIQG